MKKFFGILVVLMSVCNCVYAQTNLFEKIDTGLSTSKSVSEKIERLKERETIKQCETVILKPNIYFAKNFKSIFNIFNKNIEFEITKDFGKDVNGVQGYKAELKEGGYAIISLTGNEWRCRMKKKYV